MYPSPQIPARMTKKHVATVATTALIYDEMFVAEHFPWLVRIAREYTLWMDSFGKMPGKVKIKPGLHECD